MLWRVDETAPAMRSRVQKLQSKRVNLKDVATLAGCSTATVSRTLNVPDTVTPQVRERVLRVINELGYSLNSAARALRIQKTHMVGIAIPTLNYAIYALLVESLQQKLIENGYSLLVATYEYDLKQEVDKVRLLIERGTEALVIIGDVHEPALYDLIDRASVPIVQTYVYKKDSIYPCVGFDNRVDTKAMTEYLIGLGHRDFGVLSACTEGNDRASARVAGVRDGLNARGISLPDNAIFERPYSISSGIAGLNYLMTLKPRPTAIVCGNDILAMGALVACRSMGLNVPADVSIMGIDNLEFTAYLDPPLSTLEVPAVEMGEVAAAHLIECLSQKKPSSGKRIHPKMVIRSTTGPAPR